MKPATLNHLKTVFLEIPGLPVPKGRPRFTTRHGSVQAVTDSKTRKWETDARVLGKQAMRLRKPLLGALQVEITAFLPVPESWPKWKANLVTDHGVFVSHIVKPDVDNLAKTIDAFNGVFWRDDAQITDMVVRKRYGHEPRYTIMVSETDQIHSHSKRRKVAG